MKIKLTPSKDGVSFQVRVVPRSKREGVVGVEGEAIKIRLTAPPVEGRANAALIELLARQLGTPRANVEILRGGSSRVKVVRVRGVNAETIEARLFREGIQ